MKTLIIDYRTSTQEKSSIKKLGYNYVECPPSSKVYEAISGHPDILLHIIDNKNIIVHKDMYNELHKKNIDSSSYTNNVSLNFSRIIQNNKINIISSYSSLTSSYPGDIILNAVNTSNIFMHCLKYTDSKLTNLIKKDKKLLNVKQGYTKCSTAVVSDCAFMTSDAGIAKALHNENMDVLLLPPGDIDLPGLNYGFVGGSCGLIENNLMAFFGDIECYAYGKEVLAFLKKHKVEPYSLKNGKLTDRGSLFVIE